MAMMKKTWLRYSLVFYTLLAAGAVSVLGYMAYGEAGRLVMHPQEERIPLRRTPVVAGLAYEEVQVVSADGYRLHGWYIPPQNSAVIMMQHGYKTNRSFFIEEAEMFSRHGYGVLLTSVRAHDLNDGEIIGFGIHEMPDLDAWYEFLLQRPEVDPQRIGILGDSMGGSLAIQYAAQNENIRALVAHSAFSSMEDTITTSLTYFTGLPPFPFAPMIRFWAERIVGGSIRDINATAWIGEISPRPVFILHSEGDTVVSPQSGALLYEAAGEPRQLWLETGFGHADFDSRAPEEFERRLVAFFDRYLLAD